MKQRARRYRYVLRTVVHPRAPTVARADVERVVRRGSPGDVHERMMSMLSEYGRESWHREPRRLRLAARKLAAGSVEALRREIDVARCAYRDALGGAEYPGYWKRRGRMAKLPPEERHGIVDEDWRQYGAWPGRRD